MSTSTVTVGSVLQRKGYGFQAAGPEMTVYEALELMAGKNIGALLVVEAGRLVGMFSERDYARKVILKGRSSKATTVRDLMSSPPIVVGPDSRLRDCMVLMSEHHIRHLPVVDKGAIMGVVSIGDVVNAIIREQDAAIEDMQEYIAGTGYGS